MRHIYKARNEPLNLESAIKILLTHRPNEASHFVMHVAHLFILNDLLKKYMISQLSLGVPFGNQPRQVEKVLKS